jgi:thiol:disulfide interchange protein DsbD
MPYVRILGFVTLLLRLAMASVPAASAPLPADEAFQLRAQLDEEEGIELSWTIAPGYYLYRDRIVVTLDGQRIRTASEKGERKDDPNFGMVEVYHGSGTATVPAELLPEKGPHRRHLSGLRRKHDLLSADIEDGRSRDLAD